jgi:hypothetical protein
MLSRIHLSLAPGLVMVLLASSAGGGESNLPQRQLRAYPLNADPSSADISPDERLVATLATRSDRTDNPANTKVVETAQLWNFRQNQPVAEVVLLDGLVDKAHLYETGLGPGFTRFTSDGQLVVICIGRLLYVLSGDRLVQLRKIVLDAPPDWTGTYKHKLVDRTFVDRSKVGTLEVSPRDHRVAVLWTGGEFAEADIYDLDSGMRLADWPIRSAGRYVPVSLHWGADSRDLVIGVPNTMPCARPGSQPDLFVVDASSGTRRMALRTGLLVGDVAVTDDRAWVVDNDCLGVFVNHAPKMAVFDLHSGEKLRELSGRGSGVRFSVSAARNGNRVAAFTGRLRNDFDWIDMQPGGVTVDQTVSVWDTSTYEVVFTSQNLPAARSMPHSAGVASNVVISARGRFFLYGDNVYELPEN